MTARHAILFLSLVACAPPSAASPPSTTSPTAHRFRPGSVTVTCADSPELASLLEESHLAEKRRRCALGETPDCDIVEGRDPPTPSEIELAQRTARERCRTARGATEKTCACGQAGIVLMEDATHRFDREALGLLDAACVGGYLDACDEADVVSQFCNANPMAICTVLRAQGRVPELDAFDAPAIELPATERGCFVVDRVAPCATSADASRPCPGAPSIGATICLDLDRISTRGADARWDQVATKWSGSLGAQKYWSAPDQTLLRVGPDGRTYGRAHLIPAGARLAREAAALPHVEDVCRRANACKVAARRAHEPQRDRSKQAEDGEVELDAGSIAEIDHRDSLLACADTLAQAERFFRALGEALPHECKAPAPGR